MSDDVDPQRLELRFLGLLAKIFSDGVITDAERAELHARTQDGALSPDRIRAVMLHFLTTSLAHITADGKVTRREHDKLRLIVDELALPEDSVPEEVRRVLAAPPTPDS